MKICSFALLFFLVGCSNYNAGHVKDEETLQEFTSPIFEDIEIDDSLIDDTDDEREVLLPNFYKKVSCSLTPETNINCVLLELARQVGVSIGVKANVNVSASIVINEKPFISVIKDVCDMCNLKYTINGNFVKVEADTPYLKMYDVQFLNSTREVKAETSTTNDAISNLNLGGTSQESQDSNKENGSSSSVKGNGKTDFWRELDENIKMIINNDDKTHGAVSIHRHGGIVSVIATEKQHRFIDKYIKLLKKTTQSQVLIEAKILEVCLFDQYKGGIDWTSIAKSQLHASITPVENLGTNSGLAALSIGYNGKNFQTIMKCIEKFGRIKTLSNPRITVMNNQAAVMKIAKNEVIIKPSLYRQFSSYNDTRNGDSMSLDIQTIPIGIIFTVHPSIDLKRRGVTLTVRPTLSRVVEQRDVEVYSYASNGSGGNAITPQKMSIPIVEVREFDSVLSLKSGQVVVMGGIMQEFSKYTRAGIPGTKNKPILDFMFNAREDNSVVSELIVFLRARILSDKRQHVVHKKDNLNMQKFADDPRPFFKEQLDEKK